MKAKHLTPQSIASALDAEADRYRDLAKDLALECLIKPDDRKAYTAKMHLIRAESFRTAATMAREQV